MHDAQSSMRYKEDLDGVWPQIKYIEEENERLRKAMTKALSLLEDEMSYSANTVLFNALYMYDTK